MSDDTRQAAAKIAMQTLIEELANPTTKITVGPVPDTTQLVSLRTWTRHSVDEMVVVRRA